MLSEIGWSQKDTYCIVGGEGKIIFSRHWICGYWILVLFIAFEVLLLLFSHPIMSDSLGCHGLQHTRPPCPHLLLEFAQVDVHCFSDAVRPSYPLMPFSLSALGLSQHQGHF